MKYYAVIDTNVLVSAMLKWDSPPGHIMELVFNDCIVPVLNDEILNEYVAVLSRNKFHFPQSVIEDVINDIISKSIFINANPIDIELPDEKDRVFYEIVIENGAMAMPILSQVISGTSQRHRLSLLREKCWILSLGNALCFDGEYTLQCIN